MNKAIATILVLLTGAAGVPGKAPATRPAAKEPRDVLGRKLSWGRAIRGVRASVQMLRTRLLYGQPAEVRFQMADLAGKAPRYYGGLYEGVAFKLFDGEGKAVRVSTVGEVSYRVERTRLEHPDTFRLVRLNPTGARAVGRYLRPGKYRLTARVDSKYLKLATLTTNTVRFEVFAARAGQSRAARPPALRKKAEAMARQLADDEYRKREEASKALRAMGIDALPWLEAAASSADTEAVARAEAILWQLVQPVVTVATGSFSRRMAECGPVVAEFGEPTWRIVARKVKKRSYVELRVRAACYTSIGPPRDLRKPNEAQVKRIVARLRDKDPAVRLLAIRSISATQNATILAELVERLGDRHPVWPRIIGHSHGVGFPILQKEAIHALEWQGPAGIDALGAAVDDKARARLHPVILERLPELQFTPVGDRKKLAPLVRFVRQHLRSRDQDRMSQACEAAAGSLGLREVLPDLMALCRNERRPSRTRDAALSAICKIGERSEVHRVLLDLLDEKVHESLRHAAVWRLGKRGHREAIPHLLDLLEQDSSLVRRWADDTLRLLTDKPKGVGFHRRTKTPEARKREAEKWRQWFKEHPAPDGASTVRQGSPQTQPAVVP